MARPTECFGELALLYNHPRAATVKASDRLSLSGYMSTLICRTQASADSTLWALDRQSFQYIVQSSFARKRALYDKFMLRVPALASLTHEDRNKIADGSSTQMPIGCVTLTLIFGFAVLQHQKFRDGDYIITEGDTRADTFYILMEGHAEAKIASVGVVREYSTGDCFGNLMFDNGTCSSMPSVLNFLAELICISGELALLHSTPRAASVIAVGACSVVCIDRASFTRLLGRETNSFTSPLYQQICLFALDTALELRDSISMSSFQGVTLSPDYGLLGRD